MWKNPNEKQTSQWNWGGCGSSSLLQACATTWRSSVFTNCPVVCVFLSFQNATFQSKPKRPRAVMRDVDVEKMARSNQVRTHSEPQFSFLGYCPSCPSSSSFVCFSLLLFLAMLIYITLRLFMLHWHRPQQSIFGGVNKHLIKPLHVLLSLTKSVAS